MAVRQISTVCSFVLRYNRCELPEYTVDVIVKVRTMWDTHTLREDRDNCTLKFRLWSMRMKPFKALRARLNRYVKTRETVAAAVTAVSVAPVLEQAVNEEKKVKVIGCNQKSTD